MRVLSLALLLAAAWPLWPAAVKRSIVRMLRQPVLVTRDVRRADGSPFQYGEDRPGVYSTSLLGMLNGIVARTGWVLVAYTDDGGDTPVWPFIKPQRVWWPS